MALLLIIGGESVLMAVVVALAALAAHFLTIKYRDALRHFHYAMHSAYISADDDAETHHHQWETGSDTDPETDDDSDGEEEHTR